MNKDQIKDLHTHLDVYKMLNEMGHNFYPLRNAVMEGIKDLQADIMGEKRDTRPQVVTPPAGPASSMLVDPVTGEAKQIPDPQLTQPRNQALPADRASPDAVVNDAEREVPNAESVPGEPDAPIMRRV